WLLRGDIASGGAYDAALHAVFLGFAMSMVFGHAPVILPAVLRIPLPHQPRDYAVLTLLHAALVVRLGLGDGLGLSGPRLVGGVASGLSLLVFVASSAAAVAGAQATTRRRRATAASPAAAPASPASASPTSASPTSASPAPASPAPAAARTASS
ncbi:MAG: hypothetical protein ACTHK1_16700, partial [Actinomycetales bacterium]